MDRIDKKILEQLQNNCHISNQELAEKIALSPTPCLRRVRQLEENGYINKYVALLNPEKLGLHLTIFVFVGLHSHDPNIMSEFERTIKSLPEVIQCHLIAGQAHDYMLMVMVPNLDEYHKFLMKELTQIKGVKNIHSSFVLQKVVDKTALPLDRL